MNSFIIISKDPDKRKDYVRKFVQQHAISPFDQTVIQTENPSIGIEIIRDVQKGVYFKPLKGEKKLILLENAHTLTIEAQNALLKLLEEPPIHTYFFLSADTASGFLPTILSRCKVIILEEEHHELVQEREQELSETFYNLTVKNIPYSLFLAEKLASDKQKTAAWLEDMMRFLHKKMLESPEESREVAEVLEKLQETYRLIQTTNVNLRLLLEHTFLELMYS